MKIFERIPELVLWNARCIAAHNKEWEIRTENEIKRLMRETAPSGSGFDAGTKLESATERELVFTTSFHHMDDNGMYCGWTEHRVIVKSVFGGFRMRITGENKRGIKDYIGDVFHAWLSMELPETYKGGIKTEEKVA